VTSSEIRYRRLLALYPRDFRREYEEEMLGVLMADPRPGPGQVVDLIRAAVVARLRQPFTAGRDWRRAAWMVQFSGALLLLAVGLRRLAGQAAASTWPGAPDFQPDPVNVLRVAGWSVALAAAVFGPRLIAAAGATAGLAGEIASPAQYYLATPATVLHAFWLITAAVVVLAAGLVAKRGAAPRGWPAVAAAGVALVLHGVVLRYTGWWVVHAALPWVAVALTGLAWARQKPAVRRRMVAWAAPVLVTVPLVRVGFGGFVEHNARHPESLRFLGPVQWAALVAVPALTFWVVAELNRRREAGRPVSPARASDK
jgi:hypothetical protein